MCNRYVSAEELDIEREWNIGQPRAPGAARHEAAGRGRCADHVVRAPETTGVGCGRPELL